MRIILNPSQPRVFRIVFDPDGGPVADAVDIQANYWQESLAWWWSGQDADVFGQLLDISVDVSTSGGSILTVWILRADDKWDAAYISDVTEDVYPTDDVVNCAELVERRKADRAEKKQQRDTKRQARKSAAANAPTAERATQ
jgi:hypothetical protein